MAEHLTKEKKTRQKWNTEMMDSMTQMLKIQVGLSAVLAKILSMYTTAFYLAKKHNQMN
jgi:hypothetical protein